LRGTPAPSIAPRHETPVKLTVSRGFIGVVLVGVIGGVCTGVYEACWSLMMLARGAAAWQIGLSWTMFALSFAAFSPIAGRLIDRLDRRRLAVQAAALSGVFIAIYPMLPKPWLLIALGTVEAIGVAATIPAAQSLLSQLVHPDALGRAQGVFTTAESAMIAVGAAISGYLFTIYHWLPFVSAAVLAIALTALLPRLWRDVEGRASVAAAGERSAVAASSPRQLAGPVAEVTANV
jgi:MFS family permease